MEMVNHCGDGLVIEFMGGEIERGVFLGGSGGESLRQVGDDFGRDIWVEEEENMKKMVMMKKIDDLNNEKDEKKWQSTVLEMKIEEIMCSKREIPARI
ncbi:hypothetical protein Tco_0902501 [Tanacetum coccineum]